MKKIIDGYALIEKLYESSDSLIFRAKQDHDNAPVIIKILNHENPTQEELNRFKSLCESCGVTLDIIPSG